MTGPLQTGRSRPSVVVVVGEPLAAFVAEDGPLPTARRYQVHVTGAEVNVAIALTRLGHQVEFVGCAGDDGLGMLIERTLRSEGVGTGGLRSAPGSTTGVLIRETARHGPAEVIYHRTASAGSALGPQDVQRHAGLIAQAQWLYLSGITPALSATSRAAVAAAIATARRSGVPIAFDVNMRRKLWAPEQARPVLTALLPQCTLVFADDAELAVLSDEPAEDTISSLLDRGVRAVVRKNGLSGADVYSAHAGQVHLPIDQTAPAQDAVGAGDGFAGGYLSAVLDGADLGGQGCDRAHVIAGYAVSAVGDTTALPERWRLGLNGTQR